MRSLEAPVVINEKYSTKKIIQYLAADMYSQLCSPECPDQLKNMVGLILEDEKVKVVITTSQANKRVSIVMFNKKTSEKEVVAFGPEMAQFNSQVVCFDDGSSCRNGDHESILAGLQSVECAINRIGLPAYEAEETSEPVPTQRTLGVVATSA